MTTVKGMLPVIANHIIPIMGKAVLILSMPAQISSVIQPYQRLVGFKTDGMCITQNSQGVQYYIISSSGCIRKIAIQRCISLPFFKRYDVSRTACQRNFKGDTLIQSPSISSGSIEHPRTITLIGRTDFKTKRGSKVIAATNIKQLNHFISGKQQQFQVSQPRHNRFSSDDQVLHSFPNRLSPYHLSVHSCL